ncbi:hypothetical protein ACCO45_012586 [Purpureocillium lilacinum]|uniref:Uncharacterized protein n=1 Tax=Purpureocillium lilacinum TaxID=33203 RepID=A0ACC4DBI0_PURLI
MKATFVTLAIAGLVAAQDFTGQPDCAIPCLKDAIPKIGCKLEDVACACKPDAQAKLLPLVSGCILSKCSPADVAKAQSAANAACAKIATQSGSASGSGSASATGSGSATGSATASGSATGTASGTESATATESGTASESATGSATGTESGSASVTATASGSGTSPLGHGHRHAVRLCLGHYHCCVHQHCWRQHWPRRWRHGRCPRRCRGPVKGSRSRSFYSLRCTMAG